MCENNPVWVSLANTYPMLIPYYVANDVLVLWTSPTLRGLEELVAIPHMVSVTTISIQASSELSNFYITGQHFGMPDFHTYFITV